MAERLLTHLRLFEGHSQDSSENSPMLTLMYDYIICYVCYGRYLITPTCRYSQKAMNMWGLLLIIMIGGCMVQDIISHQDRLQHLLHIPHHVMITQVGPHVIRPDSSMQQPWKLGFR